MKRNINNLWKRNDIHFVMKMNSLKILNQYSQFRGRNPMQRSEDTQLIIVLSFLFTVP